MFEAELAGEALALSALTGTGGPDQQDVHALTFPPALGRLRPGRPSSGIPSPAGHLDGADFPRTADFRQVGSSGGIVSITQGRRGARIALATGVAAATVLGLAATGSPAQAVPSTGTPWT
ncbi:hypothetical protein GCM10027265_23350 [Jatrophihabitans fulvus]